MQTVDAAQWTVMISSTMRDLKQEREAVARVVAQAGMTSWVAEVPPFVGMSPERLCERMARECTVFILILGPSYGFCSDGTQPSSTQLSVTRQEYEWAKADNPNKILVVARDDAEQTRDRRQRSFVGEVLDFHTGFVRPPVFHNLTELGEQVRLLLTSWRQQQSEGIHGYLREVVNYFERLSGVSLSTGASLSMLLKQRQTEGDTEEIVDTVGSLLTYLRRFAVVEAAASGKTVLLQQLALDLARKALAAPTSEAILVPLYIRGALLRNDVDVNTTSRLFHYMLINAVLREIGHEIPGAHAKIAEALEAGRAVLLLDGLDEVVSDELRVSFMRNVERLAVTNRAIITTRPTAESLVADWPIFGFQRLHRYQRRALVEGVLARSQGESRVSSDDVVRLIADIETHDDIRVSATNPLLLTLMALTFAQRGTLPSEMSA